MLVALAFPKALFYKGSFYLLSSDGAAAVNQGSAGVVTVQTVLEAGRPGSSIGQGT